MWDSILNFIAFHPEITLIGAITIIQIVPIKLDPWGTIARAIKKFLVGDIEKKVDDLDKEMKESKALNCRAHILRFADELRNGIHHESEYFDEILSDIDKYDEYCDAHPKFKNSKTVISTALIKETYTQLRREHKI